MRQPTPEIFLHDVETHRMEVLLSSGLYRHLSFRAASHSWNQWFDIITWPGNLTINGDMGTWTFNRVPDMFTFFRDSELRINPSYWAEKLRMGVHGGTDAAKVWDEESFKERLVGQLTDYYSLDGEDLVTARLELEQQVLSQDCKYDLMIAARDFSCELPSGSKFQYDTCEMPSGMEYAYHFIWCLYAIVWGIQQWYRLQETEAT